MTSLIPPSSHEPAPMPIRLLMNRKHAAAVTRMWAGARCWVAVVSGPTNRMFSALGISRNSHATTGDGDRRPATNRGAVTSQAKAETLA